jgi:hypothetical protein
MLTDRPRRPSFGLSVEPGVSGRAGDPGCRSALGSNPAVFQLVRRQSDVRETFRGTFMAESVIFRSGRHRISEVDGTPLEGASNPLARYGPTVMFRSGVHGVSEAECTLAERGTRRRDSSLGGGVGLVAPDDGQCGPGRDRLRPHYSLRPSRIRQRQQHAFRDGRRLRFPDLRALVKGSSEHRCGW